MAYKDQYDDQDYDVNAHETRTAPVDPYAVDGAPVAAPVPAPAPAGPQISSAQTGNAGTMDKWFQFLNSGGYATGSAGNGFYTGGGQYRGNLGGVVDAYNKATGSNARTVSGHDDQIDFGAGAQDVLQAGTNNWWLSPVGGPSSPRGNPAAGAPAAPAAPVAAPVDPRIAQEAAAKAAWDDQAKTLYNTLYARATQAETVDPNDPIIRKQADTFAAARTREGRRYLQELAESKGPGGNIGAEGRMVAEKAAQASAEHEGSLLGDELAARRQQIMTALSESRQFMTAQQQMALQQELANMDDIFKRTQLGQQESQFARSLAQQGRSLDLNQSQFENNLGQRAYEYDTDDEYRRTHGDN